MGELNFGVGMQVVGGAVVRFLGDELEVLCALRPAGGNIGGMWEFVGGKIEPGETPEQALVREVEEEVGAIVQPKYVLAQTTMEYPRGPITLTTYYCELISGEPIATEHEELRWLPISQLRTLNWAPLDIEAVKALENISLASA